MAYRDKGGCTSKLETISQCQSRAVIGERLRSVTSLLVYADKETVTTLPLHQMRGKGLRNLPTVTQTSANFKREITAPAYRQG